MGQPDFMEAVDAIVARDPRYHRDAYIFLRAALDHTQEMLESNPKEFVEGTYNNKTGVLHLKTIKEENTALVRIFAATLKTVRAKSRKS